MEAKRVTRGEEFYDAARLEWALNTFREVMQYISAAYYPASLVLYPMESNLGYRPSVSKEVFACLEDEQVNVYRDVCRQLLSYRRSARSGRRWSAFRSARKCN